MAKQAKIRMDLDRISNLPDPILCRILSFLPTKHAARTSVLSTRWRYLYISISKLELKYVSGLCKTPYKAKNFINFVDRLMSFPTDEMLESLRLSFVSDDVDSCGVTDWICAALRRGVKELDLQYQTRDHYGELPTLLYTSESLVILKLHVQSFDLNVPTKVCLPNLKTLHLHSISFPNNDAVQRLFSSCIVLEDLVIDECKLYKISELRISNPSLKRLNFQTVDTLCRGGRFYSVVINAPNLVYFKYVDIVSSGCSITNMKSLEKAFLSIFLDFFSYDDDDIRAANNLLRAIRNVKSLHLTIRQPNTLFDFGEQRVVFHNLVELEIFEDRQNRQCCQTWLLKFLECTPNLKSLLFYMEWEEDDELSPPERIPYCVINQLKEIKMLNINGNSCVFEIVKYFLMKATVLEKLSISLVYGLREEQVCRITEQLLNIPRSSSKCELEIGSEETPFEWCMYMK